MLTRVCFVVALLCVLVASAWAGTKPPLEFPICTTPGSAQHDVAIDGNTVVWMDMRNMVVDINAGVDIYGYNLAAGKEFPICTGIWNQQYPAISGNIVVWQDARSYSIPSLTTPSSTDIYGCNLVTGQEFPICTDAGDQTSPEIYGNIVVWQDLNDGVSRIYGYNLTNSQKYLISDPNAIAIFPQLFGNFVVWEEQRNYQSSGSDIYGYNLATGKEFPICTAPGHQVMPKIYGRKVVWTDYRNDSGYSDNPDIYGYDLVKKRELAILVAPGQQTAASFYGSVIACTAYDGQGYTISGYDIQRKQLFNICNVQYLYNSPAISGNVMV